MLFLFIFVLHPLKFFILLVRPFRAALGHGEKRKCPVTANFPLDLRICFKASPSAKPFMWKWVLFTCKWTQIFMQTLDPKRWERFEEQGARQKVHILGLKCPNWFLTLSVSDKQFQHARQSVCRRGRGFCRKNVWENLTNFDSNFCLQRSLNRQCLIVQDRKRMQMKATPWRTSGFVFVFVCAFLRWELRYE